jgi:dynein heavy chain
VELSSSYSRGDWCDDLKSILRAAGEAGTATVFLFSDAQIKEEAMIEDISNLLSLGEVPNLFDPSDQVTICEAVSGRAKKAGVAASGSRAELFNFFCSEVRRFLHVVLVFSPIGDAFRTRLRKFPSLVTNTTIDWCALVLCHSSLCFCLPGVGYASITLCRQVSQIEANRSYACRSYALQV